MDVVESLRKYQCPENKGCNPVVEHCQCALMDSGADEIERLQEEHHDVRILNEQYFNENEILLNENERLREALVGLMKVQNGPPLTAWTNDWNEAMKKADAALQQKGQ